MNRTTIFLIGSEKGGMGKSMVGLVAAAQMVAANHPFYLVDADASTPNVGLTYAKEMYTSALVERIKFTGDERDDPIADRIFEIAETQDVLVVLPSQVAAYVRRWLEQSDVLSTYAKIFIHFPHEEPRFSKGFGRCEYIINFAQVLRNAL